MNKIELASYCASLAALLKDQDAAGGNLRSNILGEEFTKHWDLLKSQIQQEHANEARKRRVLDERSDEASARLSHDQSGGRGTDR